MRYMFFSYITIAIMMRHLILTYPIAMECKLSTKHKEVSLYGIAVKLIIEHRRQVLVVVMSDEKSLSL